MYRRCYRYDDQTPVVTHIEDDIISNQTPMTKGQREILEQQPYDVIQTKKEPASYLKSDTPNSFDTIQTTTQYMKKAYEKARKEIMKNGKIFGVLESDDVIILLLIVLLLAEDNDDYILLLALAALLFIR